MVYSRIKSTGGYLPDKVLTNKDLEKIVETSDEWIRDRTGISERHIAENQTATDLAEHALRSALEAASMEASALELIIVATCTQESSFPSTAARLQKRFNVKGFAAFDVNAACSGFIYGIAIADAMIRSGQVKTAAVIGAEKMSSIVDWTDRETCVLFGDGAGAIILEAAAEQGVISTHIHADGSYEDLLYHEPVCNVIKMKGNEVFRVAVRTLERIVDETLEANNMTKEDVDWLIPHQANMRIMSATAKKLNLPADRMVVTVDKHGNTSAASIPLALNHAVRAGSIKRGEVLLMEAFGGGFTWGSALVRY
ncbi:MAG: ketoacyl-ACP synthase III [Gammaproteobacteria bacterium]|nr:ketoacyl-ACP synthase III [Gammaproteobacteria bacterium]